MKSEPTLSPHLTQCGLCGDLRLSAVWSAVVCGFQTYRCHWHLGRERYCKARVTVTGQLADVARVVVLLSR